ncbi:MAG: RDD family protein [Paracoccaceae bacterium]
MQTYDEASRYMTGLPHPDLDRQFYDGVPARRLVAWVFDVIVIGTLSVLVSLLTLGIGFFFIGVIGVAISFVYRVLTLGSRSATLGMRAVGIELRDRDGVRFTTAQAIVHTLAYMICFSFLLPQVISMLMMVGTRYGQGIPDVLMGSTAINSPAD